MKRNEQVKNQNNKSVDEERLENPESSKKKSTRIEKFYQKPYHESDQKKQPEGKQSKSQFDVDNPQDSFVESFLREFSFTSNQSEQIPPQEVKNLLKQFFQQKGIKVSVKKQKIQSNEEKEEEGQKQFDNSAIKFIDSNMDNSSLSNNISYDKADHSLTEGHKIKPKNTKVNRDYNILNGLNQSQSIEKQKELSIIVQASTKSQSSSQLKQQNQENKINLDFKNDQRKQQQEQQQQIDSKKQQMKGKKVPQHVIDKKESLQNKKQDIKFAKVQEIEQEKQEQLLTKQEQIKMDELIAKQTRLNDQKQQNQTIRINKILATLKQYQILQTDQNLLNFFMNSCFEDLQETLNDQQDLNQKVNLLFDNFQILMKQFQDKKLKRQERQKIQNKRELFLDIFARIQQLHQEKQQKKAQYNKQKKQQKKEQQKKEKKQQSRHEMNRSQNNNERLLNSLLQMTMNLAQGLNPRSQHKKPLDLFSMLFHKD